MKLRPESGRANLEFWNSTRYLFFTYGQICPGPEPRGHHDEDKAKAIRGVAAKMYICTRGWMNRDLSAMARDTPTPNSPILYIYTSIHICAFCVCVFFLWKRWCWWASPALPLPHDRDTASVHIAIGLDLIIRVPGPVCIEDAVTQFLVRSVHNRAPPIQSFSLAVGKDFPFYLCILIFRWLIRDMNTALQGPARAIERIFRREYPRCVYVSIMWSAPAPLHGYLLCVLRSSDSLIYHRKWLWIGSNSVPTPAWWFHRELVKIYRLPN